MIPALPDTGTIVATSTLTSILITAGAGFFGALVRELLDNDGLKLPSISEGSIRLGFIGSVIIGSIAGYFLGDSILGAFQAGLTSSFLLGAVINRKELPTP